MGVDVSIKVRIFQDNQLDYKEMSLNAQDNSLANLFYSNFNNLIAYTSIVFDKEKELSSEENDIFTMLSDEHDEMLNYTKIYEANDVLVILNKIYNKFYMIKSESLNNDLNKIDLTDMSQTEKNEEKQRQIGRYLDYETSLGMLIGVLKVAHQQSNKIQIVCQWY